MIEFLYSSDNLFKFVLPDKAAILLKLRYYLKANSKYRVISVWISVAIKRDD